MYTDIYDRAAMFVLWVKEVVHRQAVKLTVDCLTALEKHGVPRTVV
jgi:hypothetical protein